MDTGRKSVFVTDNDGKEWTASQLCKNDWDMVVTTIRTSRISAIKEYASTLSHAERMGLIAAVVEIPVKVDQVMAEFLNPVTGLWLLWLSLRRAEPKLTLATVEDGFAGQDVDKLIEMILTISGFESMAEGDVVDEGEPVADPLDESGQ